MSEVVPPIPLCSLDGCPLLRPHYHKGDDEVVWTDLTPVGEVVPPILSAAQVSMFVNLRDDGEAVLASHEALRAERDALREALAYYADLGGLRARAVLSGENDGIVVPWVR